MFPSPGSTPLQSLAPRRGLHRRSLVRRERSEFLDGVGHGVGHGTNYGHPDLMGTTGIKGLIRSRHVSRDHSQRGSDVGVDHGTLP